jgi:ATP-dependent DNA helicase RecG
MVDLQASIEELQGVTTKKAKELHALGVYTLSDLLMHFPARYEDYKPLAGGQMQDGERVVVRGTIVSPPSVARYGKTMRLSSKIDSDGQILMAVWFNRVFVRSQLTLGRQITITGKWNQRYRQILVSQWEFGDEQKKVLPEQDQRDAGRASNGNAATDALNTVRGEAMDRADDDESLPSRHITSLQGGGAASNNAAGNNAAGISQSDRAGSPPDATQSVRTEVRGGNETQQAEVVPVYPLSGSLTQAWLRKAIDTVLRQYIHHVPELLPVEIMQEYGFMPRGEAIRELHHPHSMMRAQEARRRLVYEELFFFEFRLIAFRAFHRKEQAGIVQAVDPQVIRDFADTLPFELTDDQKQAINDIVRDMRRKYSMSRLLQGDVGSGKTVVAATALYVTVRAGNQGAFMAPTEILAEQHLRTLTQLLEPLGVTIALLTGRTSTAERRSILGGLQMGLIDIVVGTHALIQDGVIFRRLGLVITDEQHRFGVEQRSVLRRKGASPDVLSMTATPIPRTLAITVFGDMDVTTIRSMPKGRKPIITHWLAWDEWSKAVEWMEREVAAGHQVYVICPLIAESEKLDVQNAEQLFEVLQTELPGRRIGLLHGQLTPADKEAAHAAFSLGDTDVLVSTTVVEVGVDIPNATLMVITDAQRFGLSQLHQLRGRVGRGMDQSYCLLIADAKSDDARERMEIMTGTTDGFEVARRDLDLRGPGDFLGTRQSGLPEFKLANLSADFALLEQARDDAARIVNRADFWTLSAFAPLHKMLEEEGVVVRALD